MLRLLLLLAGAATIWALDPQVLLAQAANWPDTGPFVRGTGFYLSIWKVLSCWILFAAWVYTTDWVSQDCQNQRLNYALWNNIVFFTFLVAFLLVFVIPTIWVSFPLLLIAYAAPLATFVILRNKQVEYAEKVMTKAHLRRWFAAKMTMLGMKVAAEAPGVDEQGPPLKFKAMGAKTEREDNINLLTVRQSLGYIPARQAVFDALEHGADSILFDYGAATVAVRHQIDGVWHNQQPIDRVQLGDPILTVFKTLAALNPNERRAKQAGAFGIEVKKPKDVKETKYLCKFASQGTQSGERVSLLIEGKKLTFKSLAEIGMREKMVQQLEEILGQKKGLILFSALPAGGLSTTFEVALNASDRFMRNFAAVEEAKSVEREVLNVAITPYDAAAGETPATVLPGLIRSYPDVFVVRDFVNLETIQILIDQINKEERLVISSTRAKEAVEALLRILLLKIPPADFAAVVLAVCNVRLVRKLCEKCKEGYPPPSEVLKQMGLPAGRIENFYRPPTKPIDPKHPEIVCDACQGIGYRGRTGVFELLVVDDRIRSVLGTQPKLDLLRDAARKSKHRSLQEEGLLLVARGVTSLQELLRVLKQ